MLYEFHVSMQVTSYYSSSCSYQTKYLSTTIPRHGFNFAPEQSFSVNIQLQLHRFIYEKNIISLL